MTFWTADPGTVLRVDRGFSLPHVDPSSTPAFPAGKLAGRAELAVGASELAELQEKLYAGSKTGGVRRMLLVLQGMDTSGKGGVVEHVIGAISPAGVRVASFGKPTPDELAHDFLWRSLGAEPSPGYVGVFDRSHYEDVLVARVRSLAEPAVIRQRYGQIVEFERELVGSGVTLVKVMLHISAREQKKRLPAWDPRPATGSTTPATWMSAPTGPPTARHTSWRWSAPRPRRLRGTWCPPTTSGTRAWPCSDCCSTRCAGCALAGRSPSSTLRRRSGAWRQASSPGGDRPPARTPRGWGGTSSASRRVRARRSTPQRCPRRRTR